MKLQRQTIEWAIRELLRKYHADHAILFGSYARGEENEDSDIDVIVVGGEHFHATDIFAFGEDLRQMTGLQVDAFEIREVNQDTDFYNSVMRDGIKIA